MSLWSRIANALHPDRLTATLIMSSNRISNMQSKMGSIGGRKHAKLSFRSASARRKPRLSGC